VTPSVGNGAKVIMAVASGYEVFVATARLLGEQVSIPRLVQVQGSPWSLSCRLL